MAVLVATTAMFGGVGFDREKYPQVENTQAVRDTVELSLLDNVQGFLENVDETLETVVDLLETVQQLFGEGGESVD